MFGSFYLLLLIVNIVGVAHAIPLFNLPAPQTSSTTQQPFGPRTVRDAMDKMIPKKHIKPNSQYVFQATIQLDKMGTWEKDFFRSDRHEEDVSKSLVSAQSQWHGKKYSTAFLWCSADNAASPYNYCDIDILVERIPGNRNTKGWKKTQFADTTPLPDGFTINKVIGRTTFEDVGWMTGQSRKDRNNYDNFVRMAGRAKSNSHDKAKNLFGDSIDYDSYKYFKVLVKYFEAWKPHDPMYTYTPASRL